MAGYRGAPRLRRGAPRVGGVWGTMSGPPISSVAPWVMSEQVGQRLLAARQRAGLGVGDGVLDLRDHGFAHARGLRGVQQPPLRQQPLEPRDRIAPPSLRDLVP